ncbi:MAG: transcriptional regulator [Polyangiales bacterium]
MPSPKNYRSFAEFQREEIARDHKLGWSIDDLMHDAELRIADQHEGDRDVEELDFGG